MVLTREASRTALVHILNKVFDHPLDGQVFASFDYEGISGIVDFVNLVATDLDGFQCIVSIKAEDKSKA